MYQSSDDNEKGYHTPPGGVTTTSLSSPDLHDVALAEELPASALRSTGVLARIRHLEEALDRKLGVESHGIQRRLPEDRDPRYSSWSNQMVMFALWASGTMNLSCFATGFLGKEFGLDLKRSLLIYAFATLLGSMVVGWCATMGAPTGLRQISISRYSIGWWPAKFIAILNAIEQVGWSSVGAITGGLALQVLSDNKIGSELGVVIIVVLGFICSFIGLRGVFAYEKFAWIAFFVIFMVMYGETAKYGDLSIPTKLEGQSLSAAALTLFGITYGSSASWATIASDYYVEYKPNVSRYKVFILTTLGICLPTCIGMLLGAVVASALPTQPKWAAAYDQGVGFLIQEMLHPYGWAKFVLFVLVMSGVGMNCIAIYSSGLSLQQFARPLAVVPRFVFTLVCFVAIILLGLVGRNNISAYLQDFLSLLGYFTTSFFVIIFVEHYLFRKGSYDNYDLEAWNNPKKMPIGLAGGVAFALGIVGSVLGMSTTWYTGVLSKLISGGDIGNELSFLFTLFFFIPCRYLERRFIGR